ncbi:hypothetical protein FK545_01795 [Planococcus glaciei]|nr:hypothetical protein [Planococcus glaciei]QDY44700.1 hypothetical protein FK545_01795 [Planococcus glaciei]
MDSQTAQSSANLELLDQPFEEISRQEWETIHLTQEDFNLFLSEIAVEDAKGTKKVAGIKKIPMILSLHWIIVMENHSIT